MMIEQGYERERERDRKKERDQNEKKSKIELITGIKLIDKHPH